ncbi:dihydrolipoamide acetyltransferase family protein [Salinibacillus xinjiangensis]|uniref:Dihydrolipoamide acetyltransferase component of pyruvate dehydrogenase complex n=1 Tax=Salinibacillus xinjiangensis TaxID=1229268 RepID=A0A6G1X2L4_9BACI|nr:dihydrolipoamide acetyltransferase family protein [Salinibacillus xinjiangensis]MRG85237.1 hypothetical protein [Salinibacillus xinjiangensis]
MHEVFMPRLGVTMQEGAVSSWLMEEGQYVEKGDYLFEMETEKSNVEIEAQSSGVLRKILVEEGEEVPVNTVLAILAEEDEDITTYLEQRTSTNKEESPEEPETAKASVAVKEEPSPQRKARVAPKARRLAKQLGVDLEMVTGTGKKGLITVQDVEKAKASTLNIKESIPLNHVQKAMSANMLDSWRGIPQFTQVVSVNAENLLSIKRELHEVTINDIIVKAVANVAENHLIINSSLQEQTIQIYEDINVSVAVSSEHGLVVPVVKQAQQKSVRDISGEIKSLSEKAHQNKLSPADYADGTITVSNLGSLGIESGTPIINKPQSTIIFVGSIERVPAVNKYNQIEVAPMMKLSIAYDHRFIDGVTAANFTNGLKTALEELSIHEID